MINNVEVSVIIPIYNNENYLDQCLNSVCNQTLRNIEIICLNDGSTDKSLEILYKYAKQDQRIIIKNYKKNLGAGKRRNNGINIAKGKYIVFVDSDDWVEKEMLEKLFYNAENNCVDMVLFNSIEHDDNYSKKRIYIQEDLLNNHVFDYKYHKDLVLNRFLVVWSKFYKTDFIKQNNIKFPEIRLLEDIQFHIDTMLAAKRITYVPDFLYHYRNSNRLSVQNSRAVTDKSIVILKIFDEIELSFKRKNLFDKFEINFLRFKLNESKNILNNLDLKYKEYFFDVIKKEFDDMNLSKFKLDLIPQHLTDFYVDVYFSNSFNDFRIIHKINELSDNHKIIDNLSKDKVEVQEVFESKLKENQAVIDGLRRDKVEVQEVFESKLKENQAVIEKLNEKYVNCKNKINKLNEEILLLNEENKDKINLINDLVSN